MDRKEIHKSLLKLRQERERQSRDIQERLQRASVEHETALARVREIAERMARLQRERQEHDQLTGREVERLEGQLRASAPSSLAAFEIAIERRWAEIRAAAGSPSREAEGEALHAAMTWIRDAMTDGRISDADVIARWADLMDIAPRVRGPEHVEVAA